MLTTLQDKIACTPFPETAKKAATGRGFALAQQDPLQKLTVLAPNSYGGDLYFLEGYEVYVPTHFAGRDWGKTVYRTDELGDFILVPVKDVVLYDGPKDVQAPAATTLQVSSEAVLKSG